METIANALRENYKRKLPVRGDVLVSFGLEYYEFVFFQARLFNLSAAFMNKKALKRGGLL
jgi:hypothetical protein